jgi:hypothetical protein
MSVFDAGCENDDKFFEATVTAVDPVRMVCSVKSMFGHGFKSVPWLTNLQAPVFNDRVFVTIVTGNPLILGLLPKVGTDNETATHINSGEVEADAGNLSSLTRGMVNNPGKPGDLVAGDVLASNDQGGLVALLRGGTFIAKASRLAQIILSRYDDLVRLVGRNLEIFTDVGTEICANVRGRVYKFVGIADTQANGVAEVYKYTESYGDTQLGEFLRGDIYGSTPGSYPVADTILKKQQVLDANGVTLYKYTLANTGYAITRMQNVANTAYSYVDQQNQSWELKSLNTSNFYSRIKLEPTEIMITYGDQNKVRITPTSVTVTFNGTNNVFVTSTGVQLQYNNGAHFVTVDSTGVHMG